MDANSHERAGKLQKKENEDTKPMSAYREQLSPHMTQKAMTNKRTEDEM